MEIACADCGCLVDGGVVVIPCDNPDCCCRDLPPRTPAPDEIAETIRAAFATKDLAAFGGLLADDARWGDDDHPRKCRSRSDVVATFERLLAEGVDGEVAETAVGPNGVMCLLQVRWPDSHDRRGTTMYHVYLVRDGRITEIRRYDDRASSLAALQGAAG